MSEPNKVELVSRQVIEHQLLTALSDKSQVAIMATEEDLDIFIEAFRVALIFSETGAIPDKWRELLAGLRQLQSEAFER